MVLMIITGIVAPAYAGSIIINHTNWDWYNSQTQEVFNRVGQQSVFFSHASVGSNISGGMSSLYSSDSGKYQLIVTSEDGTAPSTAQSGIFYEYGRGNPGWKAKMDQYATYVRSGGWHGPAVSFSMDKLCYIDEGADANYYLGLMSGLIAEYPDTEFVLWTIPLTTSEDSDNILRNQYNNAVRNYAAANELLLLDIADIEAWSPDGVQETFVSGGVTYQKLYSGYTDDGGHLNSKGALRVATGIYSLLGEATETKSATATPIPAAVWIFSPALLGLIGIRKKFRN